MTTTDNTATAVTSILKGASSSSNEMIVVKANHEKNQELIDSLLRLSYHLRERGHDRNAMFKSNALETAAQNLSKLDFIISDGTSLMKGRHKVKGIGKGTAYYIDEFIKNGQLSELSKYDSKKAPAPISSSTTTNQQYPVVVPIETLSSYNEEDYIVVNRAPVLSLWVKIVAMKLGYNETEALSYSKWITGLLANSKGRSLGIKTEHYHHHKRDDKSSVAFKKSRTDDENYIQVFQNIKIPIRNDSEGNRIAVESDGVTFINYHSNQCYMQHSFGKQLITVQNAMQEVADHVIQFYQNSDMDPLVSLRTTAYALYEYFRPEWKGWGQKSILDINKVKSSYLAVCNNNQDIQQNRNDSMHQDSIISPSSSIHAEKAVTNSRISSSDNIAVVTPDKNQNKRKRVSSYI